MVAKIILCLVVASLLYAYTNHNREFTATASAIRQIWFGNCRLSCRRSEYSGLSGLSGLVQRRSPGIGSRLSDQVIVGQTSINSQAGPSYSCVCESCPCAVLETVIRTCRPATDRYFEIIEMLSNFYYEIVKALTDLYAYYIERVVDRGVIYQRPVQNKQQSYNKGKNLKGIKFQSTSAKLNSADNNNVDNAPSSVKDDTAKKRGKEILNLKPSAISFRRKSKDEFPNTELHSSTGGHNIAINLGRDPLVSKSESKESGQVSKSCSKCIEKGKVCMNNCPRSKVKK